MIITCNLRGGLGNQLFQIYTTIAQAYDINSSFFFPNVYELKGSVTNRYTYWDSFFSNLKPFLLDPLLVDKNNIVVLKEKAFTYNTIQFPVSLPLHILDKKIFMLQGYYQSPKYFDMYFQTINKLLKIDEIKVKLTNKYFQLINEDSLVSMHFRLGDYKKLPEHYVILSIDYYRAALNRILIANKLTKVLYFCEEPDLEEVEAIIAILKTEFSMLTFVRADPDLEDWEQLILMSLCRHNIIANSTFSWWGAYLNIYKQKMVVCPSAWFGIKLEQSHLLKDLYPDKWIKI